MSAILPPPQKIWWKQPVDKVELIWITIAFIWCMVMFFMMPYWHLYGKQNLSNETYRVRPEQFARAAQEIPVVHPPAGSDVYLLARLWQWYPVLELEQGQTYRLHLSSMDWQHGFSLQPENINLQVIPGYEMVIKITPNKAGDNTIVCNEYCGIGHHTMTGEIYVK